MRKQTLTVDKRGDCDHPSTSTERATPSAQVRPQRSAARAGVEKRASLDFDYNYCDDNGEDFNLTPAPIRSNVAVAIKRQIDLADFCDDDPATTQKKPKVSHEALLRKWSAVAALLRRTATESATVPKIPDDAWNSLKPKYADPNLDESIDEEEEGSTALVSLQDSYALDPQQRSTQFASDLGSDDSGIVHSP
ncbi:hypothetical protein AAVH_00302 [Aphelenchoides avenae]|nr:hypothetical protein AAVH_00302 [Aphelenchus avenae]